MFLILSCMTFENFQLRGYLNLIFCFIFTRDNLRWSLIYGHLVGDSWEWSS